MTMTDLRLLQSLRVLSDVHGAFQTYGYEEWKPKDATSMISPGGRVLKNETYQRLKSAAEAKQKPGTRAPKPKQEEPKPQTVKVGNAPPAVTLTDKIADKLRNGEPITNRDLWALADEAYGGTRGQGKYAPSAAYDAMEGGTNLALMGKSDPTADADSARKQIQQIGEDVVRQLPTQTLRSGNKELLQQFSTPAHYAFAAAWVANINKGDTVLEPSAGTGNIAVHAKNAGAEVYGNELDPERAEILKHLLGADKVSTENAEQIAGILPGRGVDPTVVVMNPPFSSTAGRTNKRDIHVASKHISEALVMLPPGGRLVAIVGEGMKPGAAAYNPWFRRIAEAYSLRANVGVAGEEYTKSGTSFGTRLLVIDKVPPTGKQTVTGDVTKTSDLIGLLEGVRNDRPELSQSTTAKPNRKGGIGGDGANAAGGRENNLSSATGNKGRGGRGVAGQLDASGIGSGAAIGAGAGGTLRVGLDGLAGSGAGAGDPTGAGVGKPSGRRRGGVAGTGIGTGQGGVPAGANAGQPASGVARPPVKLTLEPRTTGGDDAKANQADAAQTDESQFMQYRPQVRIAGSTPHKSTLAESSAMAAVRSPNVTYTPTLSPDIVEKGLLSDAQLEAVTFSGENHSKMLPAGKDGVAVRKGYFIGDGTGVGKGREISGIITDNFNQGRKKAVWLSIKPDLLKDAKRDWTGLGNDENQIIPFDKLIKGEPPKEGVAFVSYATLRGSRGKGKKGEVLDEADAKLGVKNVDRIVEWVGPDFDGVIAFDEAHVMANGLAQKGKRGSTKPSQAALAGIELQSKLPNARVVYVSATGATEVANLAYADRLGIWGPGTAFTDKKHFIAEMNTGGVAAMEAVAQSLKAEGKYGARAISFNDGTPQGTVTYDRVQHNLEPHEMEMYDTLATGWQNVLQNIDKAIAVTGAGEDKDNTASKNAKGAFWGAQQRFFNQLMTSIQTTTTMNEMQKDIDNGRSPVIQLTNTGAAGLDKALDKKKGEEDEEDDDYGNLDVGPREILMGFLDKSFPTERWEKYTDPVSEKEASRMVVTFRTPEGNSISRTQFERMSPLEQKKIIKEPVHDPEALRLKQELMDGVGLFKIPEAPLDQIINRFGADTVAEVTGRSQRLTWQRQKDGTMKKMPEKRVPKSANLAETAAFQDGKKKILVFSAAGGTGASYHADRTAKNQAERVHYLLQPGWRADAAVQGMGRTHRTNQKQAPKYRLVEIPQIKAQRRFISTIARRLDQLGALTRGQREEGSGGVFDASDNLETPQSKQALQALWDDMRNNRAPGLDFQTVSTEMGFSKEGEDAAEAARKKREGKPPEMNQFLNRMLSLKIATQHAVFDAFDARLAAATAAAKRAGTLDSGVETYKADKIVPKGEKVVYVDPNSGAETKLFTTEITVKNEHTPFGNTRQGLKPDRYVTNWRSGKVRAVYPYLDETDYQTGEIRKRVKLVGPITSTIEYATDIEDGSYPPLDEAAAQAKWDAEFAAAPPFTTMEKHFLTGALLPVWDKIPKDKPKIYKVKPEGGRAIVGREIFNDQLNGLLSSFGMGADGKKIDPTDPVAAHTALTSVGSRAKLDNGWTLHGVRSGWENQIQIRGVQSPSDMNALVADGVIKVKQGYETKLFVPNGPEGVEVMKRITARRRITELQAAGRFNDQQPFTAFSYKDWKQVQTPAGERMQSPSGKRTLTLPAFQKLSAKSKQRESTPAASKPQQPAKASGPLTPTTRIEASAERAAQQWATGKFYHDHKGLTEKAIAGAKLPNYMPSAVMRKPEQLRQHFDKLTAEITSIGEKLQNLPAGNAGYFQKAILEAAKAKAQKAVQVLAARLPEPPQAGTAAVEPVILNIAKKHGPVRAAILDCAAYVLRRAIPFFALGSGAMTGAAVGFIAGGVGGPAAMPVGAAIGAVVGAIASLWQVRNGKDGMRPGGRNDIVKNITGRGPEQPKGFILDRVTDGINNKLFKRKEQAFAEFAEDPAKPFDMIGVLRGMLRGAARAAGKEMVITDEQIQQVLKLVGQKLGVQDATIFKWMPEKTKRGTVKAVWSGAGAKRPVYGARAQRLLAGKPPGRSEHGTSEERSSPQLDQKGQKEAKETEAQDAKGMPEPKPKKRRRFVNLLKKVGKKIVDSKLNKGAGDKVGGVGTKVMAKKKALGKKLMDSSSKVGKAARFLKKTAIGKEVHLELERRALRMERTAQEMQDHGFLYGSYMGARRAISFALTKFSHNRKRFGLVPAIGIELAVFALTKPGYATAGIAGAAALATGVVAPTIAGAGAVLGVGGAAYLAASFALKKITGPGWKYLSRALVTKGVDIVSKKLTDTKPSEVRLRQKRKEILGEPIMLTKVDTPEELAAKAQQQERLKQKTYLRGFSEQPERPTILDVAKEVRKAIHARMLMGGDKSPPPSLGKCIIALNHSMGVLDDPQVWTSMMGSPAAPANAQAPAAAVAAG